MRVTLNSARFRHKLDLVENRELNIGHPLREMLRVLKLIFFFSLDYFNCCH